MLNDDPELNENEFEHEELEGFEEKLEPSSFESISVADIPIKISLEVSRFEISLNELSHMEPGYKLPI